MKRRMLKILLAVMLIMSIISPISTGAAPTPTAQKQLSPAHVQLHDELRRLWIEHVIWTKLFINSSINGLENQDTVLTRLLQNQVDLGNAIKPYYGEAAGNKLADLLKEHIILAGKVVDAAKSGNKSNLKKANKEWYRNADDIALFLSKANPNWTNTQLKDMMHMHLKLLTDDVVATINKDWDKDIIAFDKGEQHLIKMADILSDGIVKQFPQKF